METVGFFTLSLQTVRGLIKLVPKFMDFLSSLPNGLISQFLMLAFVWLVVPRLVDVAFYGYKAIMWFMRKME